MLLYVFLKYTNQNIYIKKSSCQLVTLHFVLLRRYTMPTVLPTPPSSSLVVKSCRRQRQIKKENWHGTEACWRWRHLRGITTSMAAPRCVSPCWAMCRVLCPVRCALCCVVCPGSWVLGPVPRHVASRRQTTPFFHRIVLLKFELSDMLFIVEGC